MEIDEQIKQLVKLQLAQSTKKPSIVDKITSLGTLFTAIASVIGAGWAIYTRLQTPFTERLGQRPLVYLA